MGGEPPDPLVAQYRSDGDWLVMDVDLVTLLVDVLVALGLSVNRDVPVAQFRHTMDNHNTSPSGWRLYREVQHLEFEEEPPGNQVLDMEQLQNQMGRTLRRSVDLSDGVRRVEEASNVIRPTGP